MLSSSSSTNWNQVSYSIVISNKVTHEPHPEYSSKVPFVLPSYVAEKKGLRFDIIFPNNTEVRALKP